MPDLDPRDPFNPGGEGSRRSLPGRGDVSEEECAEGGAMFQQAQESTSAEQSRKEIRVNVNTRVRGK